MRHYRALLRYPAAKGRSLALIAGLSLLAPAFAVCQPWPVKVVADHVLGGLPLPQPWAAWVGTAGLASPGALLLASASAGILLYLLNGLVERWLILRWTAAGRGMVYALAEDVFARLQRRSLLFHGRKSVGDKMGRVTEDSWCLYRALDGLFVVPAQALVTIVLMVLLMARMDPLLGWLVPAMAPLMVGAAFLLGKPLRAAARLRREIETRIQSHVQQTLTGIPVVQSFVQEERELSRFDREAGSAIRVQQFGAWIGSLNSLSAGVATTVGAGIVLWIGARHVLDGRLSLGSLLVFVVYLTTLQNQIKNLAALHATLSHARASADRVLEILESPPDLPELPGALPLAKPGRQVRLEEVVFGYEPGRAILTGLSLECSPGETIAVVGRSGSGKTTLVSLIPRFFDPWSGRVLIDGRDARYLPLRDLRRQVAVVLQETCLFPVSIAENIAYGALNSDRAEIEAAARAACAHDFIERLPAGYDTVIGERGGTLSGGERQRIAIARALLRNAPILILDEPTSALDARTESQVLEAMRRLMSGRTVFLVAHRLATAQRANRILVLDQGRIVESGSHEELLARGGIYHHFCKQPTQFQAGIAHPGGP